MARSKAKKGASRTTPANPAPQSARPPKHQRTTSTERDTSFDAVAVAGPSEADSDESAPRVTLDSEAFPHLIDSIFDYAPHASLLALRTVSRAFRARVDGIFARDLVFGEEGMVSLLGPAPAFYPGVGANTVVQYENIVIPPPERRSARLKATTEGYDASGDEHAQATRRQVQPPGPNDPWEPRHGPLALLDCLTAPVGPLRDLAVMLSSVHSLTFETVVGVCQLVKLFRYMSPPHTLRFNLGMEPLLPYRAREFKAPGDSVQIYRLCPRRVVVFAYAYTFKQQMRFPRNSIELPSQGVRKLVIHISYDQLDEVRDERFFAADTWALKHLEEFVVIFSHTPDERLRERATTSQDEVITEMYHRRIPNWGPLNAIFRAIYTWLDAFPVRRNGVRITFVDMPDLAPAVLALPQDTPPDGVHRAMVRLFLRHRNLFGAIRWDEDTAQSRFEFIGSNEYRRRVGEEDWEVETGCTPHIRPVRPTVNMSCR